MNRLFLHMLLVLCVLNSDIHAAKKRKSKSHQPSPLPAIEEHTGPQDYCVWDANLVTHSTTARSIVQHHKAYDANTTVKVFSGTSLAFVTPWNRAGYDTAKTFGCKLDYVSPVWYVIRWEEDDVKVSGEHEHNGQWIKSLQDLQCSGQRKHGPHVIPRFRWEIMDGRAVQNVLMFPQAFVRAVTDVLEMFDYDGLVIEMWRELSAMGLSRSPQGREQLLKVHRLLAQAVHKLDKVIVAVIPPVYASIEGSDDEDEPSQEALLEFQSDDFQALQADFDHFIAMTYDWGTREQPGGPNAPLGWVEQNLEFWLGQYDGVEAHAVGAKLLLGINFYGMQYCREGKRDAILGNTYISMLKKFNPKLEWDAAAKEHYFKAREEDSGLCTVWYPTLQSLQSRLQIAQEYHAGLGIWEIGQGLDYFFDLL